MEHVWSVKQRSSEKQTNIIASGGSATNTTDPGNSIVPQIFPSSDPVERHENVAFVAEENMTSQAVASVTDPTFCMDCAANSDMANFLSRPVLIDSSTWTVGTPYPTTVHYPWKAFFTHPVIRPKIDNYAFINCKLHVKVVISASPFYYGALLAAYRPLTSFGSQSEFTSVASPADATYLSQRPHMWILPQNNMGGELELPFLYHQNWLALTALSDLEAMGAFKFYEVISLRSANGVTSSSVNIHVYAWATDVTLTGPTVKLQSSSKIEGGRGVLFSMASSVASVARSLRGVPLISRFAKATDYAATSMAKISALFGWTNHPVIAPVNPMKPNAFHALASAHISVPLDKISVDPNNELTVDPRTVGLDGTDEMAIDYIVGREALLGSFTWAATDATDHVLWSTIVNPSQVRYGNVGGGQIQLYLTPMAMVSNLFTYWRGDIIFRFKVICTQYHRGRLRVTWDPIGDLHANVDTTTSSFTQLIDVTPDTDVEITCSYLQARAFLTRRVPTSPLHANGSTDPFDINFDNGSLYVRVLNEVSGPQAEADVHVLVFVRGANMEFNTPATPWGSAGERISYATVQSDAEYMDGAGPTDSALVSQIFGGESLQSVRPLLRRSVLNHVYSLYPTNSDTTAIALVNTIQFSRMPFPHGYYPNVVTTAASQLGASARPCVIAPHSPFTEMIPCYVGWRGSLVNHFNFSTNTTPVGTLYVSRVDGTPVISGGLLTEVIKDTTASTTYSGLQAFGVQKLSSSAPGSSLTNQHTQSGVSVLCPHYNPYRLCTTEPEAWITGDPIDDTYYEHYRLQATGCPIENNRYMRSANIQRYTAIGPDFNAFFFLGVPVIFYYNDAPAPTLS